ncbi:MAG: TonB family protein [Ignavibacteriales bacterium]|nr:TonB family protein [Ignavibacteriales bacterium]
MKTIFRISCFILFFSCTLTSQDFSLSEYNLQSGIGFPTSPEKFYDYWRQGYNAGGGLSFSLSPATSLDFVGEYSRFSVDRERLFKYLNISANGATIQGAATNVIMFSTLYRYFNREDATIPLFFLGGLSLTHSSIEKSEANYSGYETKQSRENYFALSLAYGGGISFPISPQLDIYLESKHYLGVLKNDQANTNLTSISVGLRFTFDDAPRSQARREQEEALRDTSDPPEFVPFEVQPVPEKTVNPEYPKEALEKGIEGKVIVKLALRKNGTVKKAVVIQSENEIFNNASINAAMGWKFSPAMLEGRPLSVWVTVPFQFRLKK